MSQIIENPSLTLDGIPCRVVVDGSGEISGDGMGSIQARMIYRCAWDDAVPLFIYLLGYPPGPNYTGRPRPPHAHRRLPMLKCVEAQIRKFGKPTLVANQPDIDCTFANVEAVYKSPSSTFGPPGTHDSNPPPFDKIPEFGSVHVEGSVEVVSGGDKFLELPDGAKIDTPISRTVSISNYHITLDRSARIDIALLDSRAGKVNLTPFLGFPAKSLLFDSWGSKRVLGPTFRPFSVGLTLSHKEVGWNTVWRPGEDWSTFGLKEWPEVDPNPFEATEFQDILNSLAPVP
jgi:hypothetical protein